MRVINSILGSLIGAAAGTGIYFLVKQMTGEPIIWFPLITGLLTGITANNFGGGSRGARTVCGAFAGIIACLAILSVEFIPTWIAPAPDNEPVLKRPIVQVEQKMDEGSEAKSDDDSDSGSEEGEEKTETSGDAENGDDTAAVSDSITPEDTNQAFKERGRGPDMQAFPNATASDEQIAELIKKKNNGAWYDFYLPYILCGVGALLAYQFGKGFGSGDDEE